MRTLFSTSFHAFSALALLGFIGPGCIPGELLGKGGDVGERHFEPDYSISAPAHRAELPCGDSDPSHLCVALHYVSYQASSAGQSNGGYSGPTASRSQATSSVTQVNTVWEQCHIQFFVDAYAAVDPSASGLAYQPSTHAELAAVRAAFASATQLLVVNTGQWKGELDAAGANAWTVLPSVGPFGVVMEPTYGAAGNLIAHELGHYLNLDHTADAHNAMNPIIYGNSINLTDNQCAEARATAISFWGATLR